MKILDTLKRKLFRYKKLFRILSAVYGTIIDFNSRQHKVSYGNKNADKTIFIIRPRTDKVEGLMSLFLYVMQRIRYAESKGYLFYIDMKKYETQYASEGRNAWEIFFEQPLSLTEEEVYQSKNVILCSTRNIYDDTGFNENIFRNKDELQMAVKYVKEHIRVSEEIKEMLQKESDKLDINNAVGVYMRGTDYTKLKPAGHFVQPSREMVQEKVEEFVLRYRLKDIFLVTEDMENYEFMKEKFGDSIKIIANEHFISDYNGNDFLSRSECMQGSQVQRGCEYLVKMFMLSRCRYFISSITMGSEAAFILNGGKYEDYHIFELGLYE